MRRRDFLLGVAGVAGLGRAALAEIEMGSFVVWNWTSKELRIVMNGAEQLPLWANGSQTFSLALGDHRIEAYLGSAYYRYDFRLSRTTPYREVTISDRDF